MKKRDILLGLALLVGFLMLVQSCGSTEPTSNTPIVKPPVDEPEPEKGDLAGQKKIVFDSPVNGVVRTYWLVNTHNTKFDPVNWSLWGSNDSENWSLLDERRDQTFPCRYIEKECIVQNPGKYAKYAIMVTLPSKDTLTKLAPYDLKMFAEDLSRGWEDFTFPEIEFNDNDPQTDGSMLYKNLVQDPDEFIRQHSLLVCKRLFWSSDNPQDRYDIRKVTYNLEDYDGVSGKSGGPPHITVALSTRHVENTARTMTTKQLSDETRGCLIHEMTHGYQHEPKGCGGYEGGTEFFAAIEGMAEAVRIDTGFHSNIKPNPDGKWIDGYSTTGFFIQWMRTKDPDAMRKFHDSMRALNPWSFDAGVKYVFGNHVTVDGLWNEYVNFVRNNPNYHHFTE